VAYLACARKLLASRDVVYPQFATHNAASLAAVIELARDRGGYEFSACTAWASRSMSTWSIRKT